MWVSIIMSCLKCEYRSLINFDRRNTFQAAACYISASKLDRIVLLSNVLQNNILKFLSFDSSSLWSRKFLLSHPVINSRFICKNVNLFNKPISIICCFIMLMLKMREMNFATRASNLVSRGWISTFEIDASWAWNYHWRLRHRKSRPN